MEYDGVRLCQPDLVGEDHGVRSIRQGGEKRGAVWERQVGADSDPQAPLPQGLPYFGDPRPEADRGAFGPQVRFEFRQAALPGLVANTCRNLPKVERLREDLLRREARHASLQQGAEWLALVGDLHQRPEGVEADGLDHVNLKAIT